MQLTYNTMRFVTDEFDMLNKLGLLVAKDLCFDLTDADKINQFSVTGSEPSGTSRRFMFKVGDKLYKFSGQNPVEYTGELTARNVLDNGNTAAEVQAVTNLTKWKGQKVYPVIALSSEDDTSPTARISASITASETSELDREITWTKTLDVFNPVMILGFDFNPTIVGNASATVQFAYKDSTTGEFVDYKSIDELVGTVIPTALRLKFISHVDEANGTNSVVLNRFYVYYTPDIGSIVCGETAELYTIRKNYALPLKTCAVVLKHAPLSNGASFDVYYFTSNVVATTTLKSIAVGTGQPQSVTLDTPGFVDASRFQLFFNGVETQDYAIFTSDNRVEFTAPEGAGVTATYAYNLKEENWIKMTPDPTQRDINGVKHATRYYAEVTDKTATYGGFKIVFNRPKEGNPTTITRTATGAQEQVLLAYIPDNIECSADDWDFDEDTRILTYTATAGEKVTITYSSQAPNPTLHSFTAGWSV